MIEFTKREQEILRGIRNGNSKEFLMMQLNLQDKNMAAILTKIFKKTESIVNYSSKSNKYAELREFLKGPNAYLLDYEIEQPNMNQNVQKMENSHEPITKNDSEIITKVKNVLLKMRKSQQSDKRYHDGYQDGRADTIDEFIENLQDEGINV